MNLKMAWSPQVEVAYGCHLLLPPPLSLWLVLPRKPPRKSAEEVRRRIDAESVRTAILGGTWRGRREEHQKVVVFVVPIRGVGHERWVGAEILLMTCFPSLVLLSSFLDRFPITTLLSHQHVWNLDV